MRKIILAVLVLSAFHCYAQESAAGKNVLQKYFKNSPFLKDPDSLLINLVNETDLIIDTVINPTDSSLFYLRGYYNSFNPFPGISGRTEIQYHQSVMPRADNINDTVLIYTILRVLDSTENSRMQAASQSQAVYQELKPYFSDVLVKNPGKKQPQTHSRYDYLIGLIPVMNTGYGAWYRDKKIYCLSISLNLTYMERI